KPNAHARVDEHRRAVAGDRRDHRDRVDRQRARRRGRRRRRTAIATDRKQNEESGDSHGEEVKVMDETRENVAVKAASVEVDGSAPAYVRVIFSVTSHVPAIIPVDWSSLALSE